MENKKVELLKKAKRIITNLTRETKSIILDYATKTFEKENKEAESVIEYKDIPEKFVITESGPHSFRTEQELRNFIGPESKVFPIGVAAMVWEAMNEKTKLGSAIKQKTDKFSHVQDAYIKVSDYDEGRSPCTPGEYLVERQKGKL